MQLFRAVGKYFHQEAISSCFFGNLTMATRAPKLLVQLQWFFALLWLKFDDIQIQSRESDRNDYPTLLPVMLQPPPPWPAY